MKKKCSRINAFLEVLKMDWDNLNMACKMLLFIGLILFISNVCIVFNGDSSDSLVSSIQVIIRTSFSSIFGFFLSSNMSSGKVPDIITVPKNGDNANNSTGTNRSSDSSPDDSSSKDCATKFNYVDGNLFRLSLASVLALACLSVLLICARLHLVDNIASVSQTRDLMCSSIGFLLGEAKIKKS